jgi:2-polyprenyl-3-methyl-5-hydroxy-6-metoxy-1,4-benzoquinol methylase
VTEAQYCKICNSEANLVFSRGWRDASQIFPFYQCTNSRCDFLFTNCLDNLSEHEIAAVYEQHWDSMSSEGSGRRALDKVELVKDLLPSSSIKVLDVGCGKGWGVSELRKAGFEAYGYDVTPPSICNEYITVGVRESVVGPYDLITAIEVLEHLTDPVEFCHWIASLLKDNGIFVFTTNTFSPHRHNANWWYLDIVGHVSLHTRPSLKLLAETSGFQVIADMFNTHIWIKADKVPVGTAIQVRAKHLSNKFFDPRSYRVMWRLIKRIT